MQPDLPDGDALLELPRLKAAAAKPFVTAVVSANGSVKRIREAYAAGAETFLAKPVRSTDVINFFAFQKLI